MNIHQITEHCRSLGLTFKRTKNGALAYREYNYTMANPKNNKSFVFRGQNNLKDKYQEGINYLLE